MKMMALLRKKRYKKIMNDHISKSARMLHRDVDVDEHIQNISSHQLMFFQKLVLCRDLKFAIPQRQISAMEVKANFEKAYWQHEPTICNDKKELATATLQMDMWRDLNPKAKRYTWRRNRPEVHCHLDFFLVSLSIAERISNADIFPVYKTDHSLCKIDFNYHSNPRGPSFWKLNSVRLSEVDYVNAIKSTIAETASEYESDEEVNEVLLWEMINLKIRDASMKYSKLKMKKIKNEEANIDSALAALEEQLEQGINNKDVLEEQIRCKKNELENIIQ